MRSQVVAATPRAMATLQFLPSDSHQVLWLEFKGCLGSLEFKYHDYQGLTIAIHLVDREHPLFQS